MVMHAVKPRDKAEAELADHVRKALKPYETAPKQKHVRACIVFSWDYGTSLPVWATIKLQPVLADQVPCFKALITIHKLLVGGPHVVLGEALREVSFLENCARLQGGTTLGFGYGPLIKAYVEYLLEKLEFHKRHPEFNGNFDYEEYLSLKGVSDLNEGYQTISDLMDLEAKLDFFQKLIFNQFHPSAHNECRIAALVPMVEESYGMYKFTTSMLSAMHLCLNTNEPLIPLVERYVLQFWALKKFYTECRNLRYLTSLITIPELPDEPPSFGQNDHGIKPKSSSFFKVDEEKKKSPIPRVPSADLLLEGGEPSESRPKSQPQPQFPSQAQNLVAVAVPVVDQQPELALQRAQQQIALLTMRLQSAELKSQQDQSYVQTFQQTFYELQKDRDLHALRAQDAEARLQEQIDLVAMLRAKCEMLEAKLEAASQKYDGLMKIYQNLREEHLKVLAQLKHQRETANAEAHKEKSLQKEDSNLVEELLAASRAIEEAAAKLAKLRKRQSEEENSLSAMARSVNASVFDGATVITTAVGNLIKYAIQAQEEIVAGGKGSGTPEAYYKKNSVWTEGLISAAKAVAAATIRLVETADGALDGTTTLEHLIVASNEVAAATTQLVTASRVKADSSSVAQPLLEGAARAVNDANRRLVDAASSAVSDKASNSDSSPNAGHLTGSARKVEEMNQQVRILGLEQELERARKDLAQIRKSSYREDGTQEQEAQEEKAPELI